MEKYSTELFGKLAFIMKPLYYHIFTKLTQLYYLIQKEYFVDIINNANTIAHNFKNNVVDLARKTNSL